MNKIYKVKKNAAGHLVACSEFAKGHTKKAVLGSLLIVGALGMATTASAQPKKGQGAYIGINNNDNQAPGDYSFIGGGDYNQAKGNYSTVGGGSDNQAKGNYSTVGGGIDNEAKGTYSTVGGGFTNKANGNYSTVAGGANNKANSNYSTVAGGKNNQANGESSTIGGGDNNQATGRNSTVAGGSNNQAKGEHSTIAGGRDNQATGAGSFAAGVKNKANADNAVALGKENNIRGKGSVAIGSNNTVAQGQENVFILGSNTNTTNAQSGSVLLGNHTAGKQATTVNNAKVNGLTLENFAGTSVANGVVSVGRAGGERQIVNVGAGQISDTSTDAVNGSQLYALATAVAKNKADITKNTENIKNLEVATLGNHADVQELKRKQESDIKDVVEMQNAIAEQADKNKNHIQDLAKAQLAGVAVMEELNKHVEDLYEATNDNLDKISQLDGAVFNNTQNIEDLAAYNELQDAYAKQQTEAIDALNKASSENTQNIAKNSNHIKTLENNVEEELLNLSGRLLDQKADIDNNINNIYELAQQQDQHSSDIKTLKNNVEEGLLDLSGRLIDQKADIAKNQADIAQNQTDIQDLAAYNELQDAYAKQQTEAIDALNKASSENTQNIAKNQADIANNIKNIYELAQQQDQHSSDIKTLAKVSAANTDRIAKNKAEADASFETLTKNQNTLIEQGEALVEQNKAINQELEGFAAHADVQDKQILQNQADITTNKTAIEQNINRTVANGFEIEKNKAGIATNKQELILQHNRLNRINETNNHQDQKIDQLGYALKEQGQHFNNRISAVERQTAGGIANAIAIATLPSPSRAGEHHVLFGSGYHNGQAAVSLGAAGLSDTGKSTYKIGLSWSDAGGLSGGVGGSYRWK
ncbi:YadA-like family protein [Moraxella catarrhalis]|uniref:YadA-like family protein n=1 Tax=Moraxella catarrhalis TaxID=480 RepID=UPI002359188A|nr:YadA-like family protein [Moraxella catarrhalis]